MNMDPLGWIEDQLAELERQHLRRYLQVRAGRQTPAGIQLADQRLVNFSSNDYLGLAAEQLTAPTIEAIAERGWGSGASPLVTGRGSLHAQLEDELARFEGTEAALLFSSGYAANVGAITALVGKGDVVFSDERNHASIIDGCRLSGAEIVIYPHVDMQSLRKQLEQATAARRKLIVSDSLFSMDGDLAPIQELAELARQFTCMLLVDEAHATGVFGPTGRGVCEMLGVEEEVHVRVGTLSKALGSIGGFVVGRRSLIEWLANRARPYVFSTAPPEAIAAAALAALEIVRREPQRRVQLLEEAEWLREQLMRNGWNTGRSASQIVPVLIGDPRRTMQLADELRKQGFLVPGIRPPSVPQGESLLRISLSAAHSREMLEQLRDALGRVKKD